MSSTACPGVRTTPAKRLPILNADLLLKSLLSLLVFSLALFAAASRPFADTSATMRMSEVESGTLLIKTETPGKYARAPIVKTDIRMEVSGLVARVVVSQKFTNPSKKWIEGIYVFPLPTNSAVSRLRMRIGDRFIEGKVKERGAARKIYLQALKQGKKAALTEQERPNIFTNSVANIGPGETVLVQIEYQQTLRYDRGAFALRFPMVVGPRYIPSGETVVAFKGSGWGTNTRRVPDADRITPQVRHPKHGKVNPVSLQLILKPGFPIQWIKSTTHKIKVTNNSDGGHTIVFDEKAVFAEKDLVVQWLPKIGKAPGAGLFTETIDGKTYALLMVMPPRGNKSGDKSAIKIKRIPREVVFVIDTSGSMSGTSIAQARSALSLALARLQPGDRFNVIEFNSVPRALFSHAQYANPAKIAQARGFVGRLKARGGTEMLKALNLALDGRRNENRLRQVVFLTDGSVGNEAQLFRFIKGHLGDTRLFTVGIGSAPNSYFMTKAAQYGRGTFTYISRVADVKARMTALFRKIEEPILTDIRVTFDKETGAEAWPRKVRDLYRGEPVIVAVELKKLTGNVTIEGKFAGKPWKLALPLSGGQAGKGMATLWARAKIAALMDSLHEGANAKDVRGQVISVAVKHHLVSKYTSLVAVDVTPARPKGEGVTSKAVAVNLPAGWNFEKVFGKQGSQRRGKDGTKRADRALSPSVIASEKDRRAGAKTRGRASYKAVAKLRRSYNGVLPPMPQSSADKSQRSRGRAAAGLGGVMSLKQKPGKPATAGRLQAPKDPAVVKAPNLPKVAPKAEKKAQEREAQAMGAKRDEAGKSAAKEARKSVVKANKQVAGTQIADRSVALTVRNQAVAAVIAAKAGERRDLYVALGLLVLLMAGLMIWLRRGRVA